MFTYAYMICIYTRTRSNKTSLGNSGTARMDLHLLNVKFIILMLASTTLPCTLLDESDVTNRVIKNGNVSIHIQNNIIFLTVTKNGVRMSNVLHTKSSLHLKDQFVINENCGRDRVCIQSNNVVHTVIQTNPNDEIVRVSRNVSTVNAESKLTDCYQLGDDIEWFGGPQLRYQHWPIQNMYYEEEPYLPTHPVNMALSERYWLSGEGIYIYVHETDPLFLDQNNYKDKYLCLIAKNEAPYRQRQVITLNYEIGVFPNPRLAHENIIKDHFGKPKGHPNERMIKHPIWSTWAKYKVDVSETVVNTFASEIIDHGFNNSQLEIDDNWETCYGSAFFNATKFPNVLQMTERLKKNGFRVTLWIHPFINKNCEPAYTTALVNNYFVKNVKGEVHTQWWQGDDSAAIDFTNANAVKWWVDRLKLLQQSGIDSFKFDAGEVSWLPQVALLTGPMEKQPGIFTYDYVNSLAASFDDNIEVRVGWRSQELPIFVRMIDKDTRWTWNNGLPTLITTLLQMNLNGYVHVLPDMIGGNGYLNNMLNSTVYPPRELFIRWLQANVFMPALQYSFVPWDFDDEVVTISKKYTDLHAQMTPTILNLMQKAVETGAPLNPPIWWIDPNNRQAQKINDEYLLGEDILVAPVIEEDAVSRDIYLPLGRWRDANTNKTHMGPVWLRDYPAPLNILPYFIKT